MERIMDRQYTAWIDVCHPPQAVFFTSIIRELQDRGIRVIVTVRENFESCALLEKGKIPFHSIGKHYGKKMWMKMLGVIIRTLQLYSFMRSKKLHVGLSHGSPYLKLVCFMKRVPVVAIGDNEHSKGLLLNLANKILIPEVVPKEAIKAASDRIVQYPGIKEEVYIRDFHPSEDVLGMLSIHPKNVVVTVRPPATVANYHNPESEVLFDKIMNRLAGMANTTIVLLPRGPKDRKAYANRYSMNRRIVIPDDVLSGLDLLYHSDLVLSGGGTMIREAAVLGVPAYSFYWGKILSVDNYLTQEGRLRMIRNKLDIDAIPVKKRHRNTKKIKIERDVKAFIVDEIIATIEDT